MEAGSDKNAGKHKNALQAFPENIHTHSKAQSSFVISFLSHNAFSLANVERAEEKYKILLSFPAYSVRLRVFRQHNVLLPRISLLISFNF